MSSKEPTIDVGKIAFGVAGGILVALFIFGLIRAIVEMNYDKASTKQPTYTPSNSSTKTDWEAYCRDMFPDSPSARRGCVNGATTTDDLIDGKYNR